MGIACIVVSILIMVGVLVNNLDKMINSECGIMCGYSIEKLNLFSPFDWLLVQVSKLFPLDFLLLGCI